MTPIESTWFRAVYVTDLKKKKKDLSYLLNRLKIPHHISIILTIVREGWGR